MYYQRAFHTQFSFQYFNYFKLYFCALHFRHVWWGEKLMQYNLNVIIIYFFFLCGRGQTFLALWQYHKMNIFFFLRATFKLKFEWFRLFLIKRTFKDQNINISKRTNVMKIWNNLTFPLSIYCQKKNVMIYCIMLS